MCWDDHGWHCGCRGHVQQDLAALAQAKMTPKMINDDTRNGVTIFFRMWLAITFKIPTKIATYHFLNLTPKFSPTDTKPLAP